MLFRKICILSALFFTSVIFAVEIQPFFRDVEVNDPAYKAVVKYTQTGIFKGINGEAKLNDFITKEHATLFLMKVMGTKNPNIYDAVNKGLLSNVPPSDQLLDHASWIKILSNAFQVPIGNEVTGQPWFVAPYVIAQGISAVRDEKPFDPASRRFVLRTTELYERIFGTKNADKTMNEQELRLMKMRDMLIDPQKSSDEIEELLWKNILSAEDVPENPRIQSIKHLNMAVLILLEMRKDPNENKKFERQKRAAFFLDHATNALPDVAPFAEDLRKIGEN